MSTVISKIFRTQLLQCPACRSEASDDDSFCQDCGAELAPPQGAKLSLNVGRLHPTWAKPAVNLPIVAVIVLCFVSIPFLLLGFEQSYSGFSTQYVADEADKSFKSGKLDEAAVALERLALNRKLSTKQTSLLDDIYFARACKRVALCDYSNALADLGKITPGYMNGSQVAAKRAEIDAAVKRQQAEVLQVAEAQKIDAKKSRRKKLREAANSNVPMLNGAAPNLVTTIKAAPNSPNGAALNSATTIGAAPNSPTGAAPNSATTIGSSKSSVAVSPPPDIVAPRDSLAKGTRQAGPPPSSTIQIIPHTNMTVPKGLESKVSASVSAGRRESSEFGNSRNSEADPNTGLSSGFQISISPNTRRKVGSATAAVPPPAMTNASQPNAYKQDRIQSKADLSKVQLTTQPTEQAHVSAQAQVPAPAKKTAKTADADMVRYNELLAEYFSQEHKRSTASSEPPSLKEWLEQNKPTF